MSPTLSRWMHSPSGESQSGCTPHTYETRRPRPSGPFSSLQLLGSDEIDHSHQLQSRDTSPSSIALCILFFLLFSLFPPLLHRVIAFVEVPLSNIVGSPKAEHAPSYTTFPQPSPRSTDTNAFKLLSPSTPFHHSINLRRL